MAAAVAHSGHSFADPRPGARQPAPTEALDALLLVFEVRGLLASVVAVESRTSTLTPTEAVALIALSRESLPVSGIARVSGIRPNGASVLVERLRERQLVRRQRSRRDNRVVAVELTDSGRELVRVLTARVETQLTAALSALTPVERDQCVAALRKLAAEK